MLPLLVLCTVRVKVVVRACAHTYMNYMLPVIMNADLMAAGDQCGCRDLSNATTPNTAEQDIEVPDIKV